MLVLVKKTSICFYRPSGIDALPRMGDEMMDKHMNPAPQKGVYVWRGQHQGGARALNAEPVHGAQAEAMSRGDDVHEGGR